VTHITEANLSELPHQLRANLALQYAQKPILALYCRLLPDRPLCNCKLTELRQVLVGPHTSCGEPPAEEV
jgi:hypothetical protein